MIEDALFGNDPRVSLLSVCGYCGLKESNPMEIKYNNKNEPDTQKTMSDMQEKYRQEVGS